MKLSELEKLANETGYMGRADPEDILTLCATFMEMLEAMKYVQKDLDIRAHLMPDFDESDPCVYIGDGAWKGLCAAIKKAEEML